MAAYITLLNYTCILCVHSIIVYCPAWQMLIVHLSFAALVCNCNKEHYYYYCCFERYSE